MYKQAAHTSSSAPGILLAALLCTGIPSMCIAQHSVPSAPYHDYGVAESRDFVSESDSDQVNSFVPLPDSTYSRRIDGLIEVGRAFGRTEAEIRQALGEPAEVNVRDTTNIHTGAADTYLTLNYDGMAFALYRVNATGDELLSRTIITGPVLDHRLPLSMGAHQVEILEYLGEPFHAAAHGEEMFLMQYESAGEGATEMLEFRMEGDHLVRIEWVFYVD